MDNEEFLKFFIIDKEFLFWTYEMYNVNRDEKLRYRENSILFDDYYKNNMQWLKLKYKELKEKGN